MSNHSNEGSDLSLLFKYGFQFFMHILLDDQKSIPIGYAVLFQRKKKLDYRQNHL